MSFPLKCHSSGAGELVQQEGHTDLYLGDPGSVSSSHIFPLTSTGVVPDTESGVTRASPDVIQKQTNI